MDLDSLFNISAQMRGKEREFLELDGIVDPHVHGRGKADGRMQMAMRECAGTYAAIVDVANIPGRPTQESSRTRLGEMRSCLPAGSAMQLMTVPLVNDTTDPEMIRRGWDKPDGSEDFHGVKVFWEGVSNDFGNSITHIDKITELLKMSTARMRFKTRPMPVTYHAECAKYPDGKKIPIKDREFYCVTTQIAKAVEVNPEAAHVIRHASDYRTVEWAVDQRARGVNIHIELSPQYAILIDDDIFTGNDGLAVLQCNCVFWPRPKDEQSRSYMAELMLKGYDWVHYGLDYAMHLDDPTKPGGVKINNQGLAVGGLNFMPSAAVSIVIDYCVSHGKKDILNGLLCTNAAKLYGIKLQGPKHRFIRADWKVPAYTHNGADAKSACFLADHTMRWKRFQ